MKRGARQGMDYSQHTVWRLILERTYQSGSMTPAEKQTLLLTLQQVCKDMRELISTCCSGLLSITVKTCGANTPEAWLARHGHLLAELHVGKGVVQQQQLAAIARGLAAPNARPGGLQLQVFTGHNSRGMAAVLAELQSCSQHLTRLELQPALNEEARDCSCVDAVKELLPQLQQLRALTCMYNQHSFYGPRPTISVAHLSYLTSLNFNNAFVSPSEGLPSSLQQLQLDPIDSIDPLMQLTGLRSLQLNLMRITDSSERQQLLEQVAAQCTSLREVDLAYYVNELGRGEMAAWARLPVCRLKFVNVIFPDREAAQLFPHLLAATHKHLTDLSFSCVSLFSRIEMDAVEGLHTGLAQLTGLHRLELSFGWSFVRRGVEQLCEVVGAQLVNLRELTLSKVHVSNKAVQHLSAAQALTHVDLDDCSWDNGVCGKLESRFEKVELKRAY